MTAVGTAPGLDDLVDRARTLVPRLAARAAEAERLRRMPGETMADFREAGLLLPFVPTRFGGYEMDYGPVQVALGRELGRACGSSAWIQSVLACHAWILGMFPERAQETVWADDPNTVIASAFAPLTGTAARAEGGYVLNGDWQFSSGIDAAEWIVVMTPIRADQNVQLYFCLVNKKDFEVLDTWHAPGLRGTGSNDVRMQEAFVPSDFMLNVSLADGRPTPGSAVNANPIYRLPLWSLFSYNIGCPALGIARGAVETYVEQAAARADNANTPGRHARIAEAAAEVDAAEAMVTADAREIARLALAGQTEFSLLQRATWRRNMAYAVLLCTRAVERLAVTAGAHGMSEDNPVHRASRDVHAVANHAGLQWDNHGEIYGRLATGLEPIQRRTFPLPI
jgi:3-hydroxy-9,10-secoandrosta-1,3,5(10)-triene-9,17-dione monooxygenase